jgi:hypothetical protein
MLPRQKLSRAAPTVNRDSGTECAIGVGSGELLGGISDVLIVWGLGLGAGQRGCLAENRAEAMVYQ